MDRLGFRWSRSRNGWCGTTGRWRAYFRGKADGDTVYAGNIDPNRPMVALTYDDGPSPTVTPRILNCLKENGGRATFFMVGQKVIKSPDVLKQMVAQGCEVANHTFDHTLMTKVSPTDLANQLVATNQVVSDACGISRC